MAHPRHPDVRERDAGRCGYCGVRDGEADDALRQLGVRYEIIVVDDRGRHSDPGKPAIIA